MLFDNNEYVVAAILMDLSKAFDCLPHNIYKQIVIVGTPTARISNNKSK